MIIKLIPQRRDDALEIIKIGSGLKVNGIFFDFSSMGDGDTLPAAAIDCPWFFDAVYKKAGELEFSLLLPLPWNYSPEQTSPTDLVDVPDGLVMFPQPLSEIDSYPEKQA
jgi:hypothetical protein